jgi:hypothetical protein
MGANGPHKGDISIEAKRGTFLTRLDTAGSRERRREHRRCYTRRGSDMAMPVFARVRREGLDKSSPHLRIWR